MAIFKDLTGQTFGLLTVLQRVENNSSGTAQWLCQCVCRKTTKVTSGNLNHKTRTCGSIECHALYRKQTYIAIPKVDISGQRFGKLLAIKYIGVMENKTAQWEFLCDCGNIYYTDSSHLHLIAVPSCTKCIPKYNDLSGQKFGKLLIISFLKIENNYAYFNYICDCGNIGYIKGVYLTAGGTQSCGCLHTESISTHGYSSLPEYKTYHSMISRCYNPNDNNFILYGAKGITVCDRWLLKNGQGITNFIHDMGLMPAPGYSIERLNNSLGYSPDNCIWIPKEDQYLNKTSNILNHDDADNIRDLVLNRHVSQCVVAMMYDVTPSSISSIIANRNWVR